MTIEEIKALGIDGLEKRMGEIKVEMENDDANIEALTAEVDAIEARKAELKKASEQRAALRTKIATGQAGTPLRSFTDKTGEERSYDYASPEYRTAWLKNIAVRDGVKLFGEMNTEERAAFTFVTTNSAAVVPKDILDKIVELVESMAPIYDDATKSAMTHGFAIPRHKAIDAGDAKVTGEGVANDDEQDTFDQLALDGKEIKKHIEITRKMKWESLDAFQSWIETHLAKRMAVAKEKHIITCLDAADTGIATGNVLTGKAYDDATIRSIFAMIKETGAKCVYANNNTIWNGLFGITDANKRQLFIPDQTGDPIVQGRIYGATVKQDENLADNVAYIGVPASILANNFEELFINHAIEPKTFKEIVSAYSLFDAGLENPLAFVKVTFTA